MELIDTHAHLTFAPLDRDIEAVFARSMAAGVTKWVTVGTEAEDNKKAVELANKYENLYAAVGIHPHVAANTSADDLAQLKELAKNSRIVAIGETGLDFHYNFSKQPTQKELFRKELAIAAQLNLPVIIHSRNAFAETVAILDEFVGKLKAAVFHCFSYSPKQAVVLLKKGFYISFTGVVTFKNAHAARQSAKLVPLDRLMVETDCPYMSPEPMRKQKVNEPALMVHTARLLAEIKGMEFEQFCRALNETTNRFFGFGRKDYCGGVK